MKILLCLTLLNLALIVAPLVVALPPVRQTAGMLAGAHAAGTLAQFTSAALFILIGRFLWRERTWRWLALLTVALGCVALSRINLLEWVFPGAGGVETAAIGEFHDVRDEDMVIGVVIDGQSRAYPVRYLAYHHMLNDRLGRTALLPTY